MFTKKPTEQVPVEKGETKSLAWRDPFGPTFMVPFPPVRRMFEDMERMFDELSRGFPTSAFGRFGESSQVDWTPEVEFMEKDGVLKVRVDLPGLTKDDVKVEIKERELTIEGERKVETEEKGEGFYRSERTYGTFSRTLPLPEGVDADKAHATFVDGVLEVTVPVPVREVTKARQLEIGEKSKKVKAA